MNKDRILIRAYLALDDDCIVDLTITGTPTTEGKARLFRLIELAMVRDTEEKPPPAKIDRCLLVNVVEAYKGVGVHDLTPAEEALDEAIVCLGIALEKENT